MIHVGFLCLYPGRNLVQDRLDEDTMVSPAQSTTIEDFSLLGTPAVSRTVIPGYVQSDNYAWRPM